MALSKQDDTSNVVLPGEEPKDVLPCLIPPVQSKTSTGRTLNEKEMEKLTGDQTLVSDFKQMKLEKEAQKNWDLFYKRNTTNFFKDRHWTTREFEELKVCLEVRQWRRKLLGFQLGVHLNKFLNMVRFSFSLKPRSWSCLKLAVGLGTASSHYWRKTSTSLSMPVTSHHELWSL